MREFIARTIKAFLYATVAVAMIRLFDIKPEAMAIGMACCALAKGGAK